MNHSQITNKNSRRIFLVQSAACYVAIGASSTASAQSIVLETDTQAVALGYKADASKVDKAKQPKYVAGQLCSNCALFQGAANASAGGCPLFAEKQIAAKAWCNAWAKKA